MSPGQLPDAPRLPANIEGRGRSQTAAASSFVFRSKLTYPARNRLCEQGERRSAHPLHSGVLDATRESSAVRRRPFSTYQETGQRLAGKRRHSTTNTVHARAVRSHEPNATDSVNLVWLGPYETLRPTGRRRHGRSVSSPHLLAWVTTRRAPPPRPRARAGAPICWLRRVSSADQDTASRNRSPHRRCRRRSGAW